MVNGTPLILTRFLGYGVTYWLGDSLVMSPATASGEFGRERWFQPDPDFPLDSPPEIARIDGGWR